MGTERRVLRILGRYELLEQVGSGGMAVVYRGRDTALDREVAVKLLHPHLASAPESRARFSREARAVARLSHPSIVEIYDYAGDAAVESFLVTEFVRGPTLREFAQKVGFGFPEIGMLVGRALTDALVHAHSAGVIHRDLKPENVLIQDGGPRPAVKLADFGIARILASDERMTMTGALVGSPHHMAPEIVEGRDADARSDLFSLGTLLYWLATGKLPFAASNPTAILRRVLEGDFDDPRLVEPRVPDPIADLVVRCLSVDPAARPASAAAVRDLLDRALAEVGLERPEEELVSFLRDPASYRAAFPPRAVAALTERGDAALVAGGRARALAFYNRVLAIDPENDVVPAKLAKLGRQRRLRRIARSGAVVALLAFLASAGAWIALRLRDAPKPPAAAPHVDARPAEDTGPAGGGRSSPGSPVARAPSRLDRPDRPANAAPPDTSLAGPTVALSVHIRPYAQRALLDGVEVASGAQQVAFELVPGKPHVIQLEHACCAPFVKQITAEEAAQLGELRVPLEPLPARVRVEGEAATRVWVDGRLLGTAADSQRAPFAVPVPGGASPYEGTARLELELPGSARRSMQVRLRAGAEVVVAAPQTEAAP
jgi:eukaryotic-like serine/threonine-protein kinase